MTSDEYLEAWQQATSCSDDAEHYTKATLEKYLLKLFEEKKFSGIERTRMGRERALRALWDECGDPLKIACAVGSALTHKVHALKYVFGCLKRFSDDTVETQAKSKRQGAAGDGDGPRTSDNGEITAPAASQNPPETQPSASPQLENGYVRIANEVLDNLMKAGLNGSERALVDAVIRLTWGWKGRKMAAISLAEFCRRTNQPECTVARSLRSLRERKFILTSKGGGRGVRSKWGLNKNWRAWITLSKLAEYKTLPKVTEFPAINSIKNDITTLSEVTEFPVKNDRVSGSKSLPEQGHQPPKDSIKERKERKEPPIVPLTETSLFEIWNAESGELRKITTYMTQLKKVAGLVEFFNQFQGNGTDPVQRWTELVRHAAKTVHPEHRGFIEPVWIGRDLIHIDEILANKYAHSFKGDTNGKRTGSRKGHLAGDRADFKKTTGPGFVPRDKM